MLEDGSRRGERQSCEESFGSRVVRVRRECGTAQSVLSRDGESAERGLPRNRGASDAPRAERQSADRESAGRETAEGDEPGGEAAERDRADCDTAEGEQISDCDVSDCDPAARRTAFSAPTSRKPDIDQRQTEEAERGRVSHYITISPCGPPPRGWSRSLHGRIVSTFWNPRGSFRPR